MSIHYVSKYYKGFTNAFTRFFNALQRDRSSLLQMFFKIRVLKHFAILTGKHLCWSLFLITYKKKNPTKVLSCEYSEIFKKFFYRTPLVAASKEKRKISAVSVSILS